MNKTSFGTFRGRDLHWNTWRYGAFFHEAFHTDYSAFIFQDHNDVGATPMYNRKLSDNVIEVSPESLAMFTGICDTNDKPIYGNMPLPDGTMSRGGDIVVIEGDTNQERYIVEFRVSGFHLCSLKAKSHIRVMSNLDELKVLENTCNRGYTSKADDRKDLIVDLEQMIKRVYAQNRKKD